MKNQRQSNWYWGVSRHITIRLAKTHWRSNSGMTLIELAIVSTLIGILSVVGFPSFITLYNNQKLKSAAEELQMALLNAQRQSRRLSRQCPLSFVTNASTKISEIKTTQPGCLAGSETKLPSGVILTTDLTNLTFSFRGIPDKTGVISLSLPKLANETRCVEIVTGLGLIKQGILKNATCKLIY